jgi:hypothetical protein
MSGVHGFIDSYRFLCILFGFFKVFKGIISPAEIDAVQVGPARKAAGIILFNATIGDE